MLREAIVNALVHSDYAQRGTPIRVTFFDDCVDFENPGLLKPDIEEIATGVQVRIYLGQRDTTVHSGLAAKIAQYLGMQITAKKAELAKALGDVSVSCALHRQIRRLPDAGIIEMTIPEKPLSRLQQRHRVTELDQPQYAAVGAQQPMPQKRPVPVAYFHIT